MDPMEEPSVLDYVKARLTFWKPSSIQIPTPEPETQPVDPAAAVSREPVFTSVGEEQTRIETTERSEMARLGDASGTATGGVPPAASGFSRERRAAAPALPRLSVQSFWLAGGALVLALVAQGMLEPPNRAATAAAVLYALSAGLWGFAFWRGHVVASPVPTDQDFTEQPRMRWEGLLVGGILMILTFFAFSLRFARGEGDEVPYFNFLNTALWLLSIGYLVWSFYMPYASTTSQPNLRARAAFWLARRDWRLNVTRWGILLFAVALVVLFFRFYRLDNIPAEMVSDHAEKLLDVGDVLNGKLRVFFPRNTGREAFQFYWTALMVKLFDTGISFMALKLGTVLGGLLALVYIYRLGNLIGNRWIALYALLFCGFSYWGNIQSRIGLRFPLYPMFYAPALFYLIRGLKEARRNDFIWAGLFVGIGLHGYTSFRIVPFVIVAGVLIYWLHQRAAEMRWFSITGLVILALVALAIFMPLLRFSADNFDLVAGRSLTRLSDSERPLPGPPVEIFAGNVWNALVMFFWDNGDVWVHSITHRPALDVISAVLFFLGVVLVLVRYARKRGWVDLFLLVSIPLLLMPSILSLAFPNENPNLNRTAAAYVPVFLILAVGLDALLTTLRSSLPERAGTVAAWSVGLVLIVVSMSNNYDLLFNQYDRAFRLSSWNSTEMGQVIRDFVDLTGGRAEDAWVVAYPYWVDTRLVGVNAGFPARDTGIAPEQLGGTVENPRAKLFLVNTQDTNGLSQLQSLYPDGRYWQYTSRTEGKDFLIFMVPPDSDLIQNRD